MHSQTRIVLILATTLVGAGIAVTMGNGSSQPSPGSPHPAAMRATAESPERPATAVTAAFADLDPSGESPEAPIANQRTRVELSPSERRASLTDAARVRIRAATLAQQLQLSAVGEESLTAVLLEEQSRRAATFAELRRKPDQTEVKARVRAELDAILAWKTKALRDQFGAQRAEVMMRRR